MFIEIEDFGAVVDESIIEVVLYASHLISKVHNYFAYTLELYKFNKMD